MKDLIKKNQLMITALAIMLAIAGYLQFAGTNLEEEYLSAEKDEILKVADNGEIMTAEFTEIPSLDSEVDVIMEDYLEEGMEPVDSMVAEVTPEEGEIPGEAVFTSTSGVAVLSEAKLLKEQTRAKNKETLLEIINSAGLTDAQKQDAVNSMVEMTAYAEAEAAAEILLEAKGFSDVVVSINSDAVDVVVNAAELSDAQRAQIEDVVTRKTDVPAENIVISTVVQ